MTMLPPQNGFKHIVAIEVAKDELVIHILPGDRRMRIANTAKAIQRLLRAEVALNEKHRIGPLLVICEATGGYERHVLEATVASWSEPLRRTTSVRPPASPVTAPMGRGCATSPNLSARQNPIRSMRMC